MATKMAERIPAERVRVDPIHARAREVEVIDTDFHFLPTWEKMREYMPEPFASGYKRYPPVGSEYPPDQAIDMVGTGQSVMGVAETAEDVLRVIDEIGVSTVMLSPGFQRPQSIYHPRAISALSRAFNDYLANEVMPASPRIKAEIMVNQRVPEEGAAEIRRVAKNENFISIYTMVTGRSNSTAASKIGSWVEVPMDS